MAGISLRQAILWPTGGVVATVAAATTYEISGSVAATAVVGVVVALAFGVKIDRMPPVVRRPDADPPHVPEPRRGS